MTQHHPGVRPRSVIILGILVAFTVTVSALVASAVVLDKGAEQKHRRDIGKQVAKLAICLAKAGAKCEKSGETSAVECNLVDPDASSVPDKAAAKLAASIAKCESKLNFTKKGPASNYSAIGCPGDSDAGAAGDQPYADLDDYEANVGLAARMQLSLLTPVIDVLCGGPNSSDNDVRKCVELQVAGLTGYAQSLFTCHDVCENSYNAGNGGSTDSTVVCAAGNPGAADSLEKCVDKALNKVEAKVDVIPAAVAAVNAAINDATNDLYNEDDCP